MLVSGSVGLRSVAHVEGCGFRAAVRDRCRGPTGVMDVGTKAKEPIRV